MTADRVTAEILLALIIGLAGGYYGPGLIDRGLSKLADLRDWWLRR